eukprot:1186149-Prorocentrum_minimum.AAC.5
MYRVVNRARRRAVEGSQPVRSTHRSLHAASAVRRSSAVRSASSALAACAAASASAASAAASRASSASLKACACFAAAAASDRSSSRTRPSNGATAASAAAARASATAARSAWGKGGREGVGRGSGGGQKGENTRNGLKRVARVDALDNITPFYGPSCANNGKDALNTPETLPRFSPCVQLPTFSHLRVLERVLPLEATLVRKRHPSYQMKV